MKKLISILLSAILLSTVICAAPFTVSAAGEETENLGASSGTTGDCTWTLDDNGTLTISGNGKMWGYDIKYENGSWITTAPWGAIIKSVVIKNGVTSIGDYAFRGCTGLTSVTIPDSVTSIGYEAFDGCTGLTSVTIPDSVTSIGELAFYGCTSLTSVTIGNSVTSIDGSAFRGCTGLTSVTIPDSVTSIGEKAFYGCKNLISIDIPDSVTSIGNSAFSGTTWFNDQPDGLIYAGKVAYKYKGTMPANTSVVLKEGTKGISSSAFKGCTGLTSVTIGNGVTSIGDSAFNGCTGLTSIEIPDSVTSIGNSAFYGCTGLTGVYIDDIAAWCKISFSSFSSNPLYYARNLYLNNELITNLIIPDEMMSIDSFAFIKCVCLTSIEIPDSVTSIGSSAFSGCKNLTSIDVPESVTSIDSRAFSDCIGLESVTIPDSVTSLGDSVFDNTAWYNNQPDGLIYAGKVAYKYKGTMPENAYVIIREGTKAIADTAFIWMYNLRSIAIPDSVTNIGNYAFFDCGLTSVDIPDSVTSIGDFVFSNCIELKSVTIPDSVTSIGMCAFESCALSEVTIPESVTSIGVCAFAGCMGIESVTIPKSVTSIGNGAFGYNSYYGTDMENKKEGFIVYGEPDTEAERYAFENGFLFNGEYIGEPTTAEPTEEPTTCEPTTAEPTEEPTTCEPTTAEPTEEPTTCEPTTGEPTTAEPTTGEPTTAEPTTVEPKTVEPTTAEPTTCEPTTEPINWLDVKGVSNYSPTVNVTMYAYSGSDTATIVFTAIETLDVSCFNFGLNYDKNKLELVSESYFTDDMVTNNDSSDYCINGNVANSENPYHITKKQALASFTFKQRGYEKTTVDFRVINMEIRTAYDEQFRVVDGVLQPICLHKSALVEKGYPADCVNNGLTDYSYCPDCNKVFSEKKVIPATGHKPVIDPAVPATCQHDGHTIGSHCENCGLIYVQYDIIPKLPHTEVYDEAVAPSCTETGLTAGSHCSVCGEAIKPQSIVPALGHSYVAVPGKPATHFKTGTTDGIKCSRCGEWLIEQEIIPKLEGDVAIGDSNGDGNVDVLDAATIQKFASGIADMTNYQQYFADVNNDGVVDILDAAEIQKFAAGIITEFKIKG